MQRASMYGPAPRFLYGGVSFRLGHPWPMGWRESDPLYVDNIGGNYVLCNRMQPDTRVDLEVAQCDSCAPVQDPATNCSECVASMEPATPPTVIRGMTIRQTIAVLGTPKDVIDLGMRKILLYDNMRLTFFGGRLSDFR